MWDDLNISSVYDNVAHMTLARDEITLLLVERQVGHARHKEVRVQLIGGVFLRPHAEKWLSILLKMCSTAMKKGTALIPLS